MLADERGGAGVDQPAVEGNGREGDVIAVARGVVDHLPVPEEPVGGPVEVGIVDHKGRPQRRQRPSLGAEDEVEEVQQRQQPHEAAGAQMVAQALPRIELGERVGAEAQRLARVTGLPPDGCARRAREYPARLGWRRRRLAERAAVGDLRSPQWAGQAAVLGEGDRPLPPAAAAAAACGGGTRGAVEFRSARRSDDRHPV